MAWHRNWEKADVAGPQPRSQNVGGELPHSFVFCRLMPSSPKQWGATFGDLMKEVTLRALSCGESFRGQETDAGRPVNTLCQKSR